MKLTEISRPTQINTGEQRFTVVTANIEGVKVNDSTFRLQAVREEPPQPSHLRWLRKRTVDVGLYTSQNEVLTSVDGVEDVRLSGEPLVAMQVRTRTVHGALFEAADLLENYAALRKR